VKRNTLSELEISLPNVWYLGDFEGRQKCLHV